MKRAKSLILFTNTYPYGNGETFLDDEIKHTAKKFEHIYLYPLYIPIKEKHASFVRPVPENVFVKKPFLKCDHKSKIGLLYYGTFNFAPLGFAVKEFFAKKIYKSAHKTKIFLSYTFIFRAAWSNKKVIRDLSSQIQHSSILYSFWGDTSALMFPFFKKEKHWKIPMVARFNGSDAFEEAKGFLPFRETLYPAIDYAIPASQNIADYIRTKYPNTLPKHIHPFYFGSNNRYPFSANCSQNNNSVNIVSCSNIIELKRIHLIAKALISARRMLKEKGMNTEIKWTHIGSGPLYNEILNICQTSNAIDNHDNTQWYDFKGQMRHEDVLQYYYDNKPDLFIHTSRSEGFGVVFVEALSFGIPVMSTDVGGVKEILITNKDTGKYNFLSENKDKYVCTAIGYLLSKEIDTESIAKAVVSFISLPAQEKAQLRSNARSEWEQNWNADNNYEKFAEFLYDIASDTNA